ncbi:MAG TPA: glycosyltransferase family 4 protein [Candidatus Acidoferrum sp.]|nr:glycosyltransferase family 4 protein [Candidatus Acidoferrum sp.]
MKILLLNLYYPPDTSATAKMAQAVVDTLCKKHEVTVVCGRPSYDPTGRRAWRPWQTERSGNLNVIRVGSTAFPRFDMKKRVLNYLSYVLFSLPRALLIDCDTVIGMTDPPFEGIVGAFIAMLKGKPYIYNIRDMYPDMAVGGSIVAPGLLARIWEKLHRWALRRATCLVVLGEDMKNRIVAKGIDAAKLAIVRDGADILGTGETSPELDEAVIREIRGEFSFVLLHAGNVGFYGAWSTLLAAAKELSAENVGFVFVGEGAQRDALAFEAGGIANAKFLPFFPGNKVPSVLAAADAHLITIKRGLEGVVVPSKMYGILAAGKPIVAVTPSETDVAMLAAKLGFGIVADPDRPAQLAEQIRVLAADRAHVNAMGLAAKAAAPDFDRAKELEKFVGIAERTVALWKN